MSDSKFTCEKCDKEILIGVPFVILKEYKDLGYLSEINNYTETRFCESCYKTYRGYLSAGDLF